MKRVFSLLALFIFITCSIATTAQAWTLLSPLEGDITDRTVTLEYGVDWLVRDSCYNEWKLHAGVDVDADVGEYVYAAYDGYVKVSQYSGSSDWGYWVTIEHSSGGSYFTTVYWHLQQGDRVEVNEWVEKGDIIGKIHDQDTNTHLHFGIREASYSNTSNRGALPQQYPCAGDPAFPELFFDPMSLEYEYNYN